jgi:hypothetical protein
MFVQILQFPYQIKLYNAWLSRLQTKRISDGKFHRMCFGAHFRLRVFKNGYQQELYEKFFVLRRLRFISVSHWKISMSFTVSGKCKFYSLYTL